MSVFNKKKYDNGSCDWNTPKKVWDIVIPFIPKEKEIWMPFYNDGYCGDVLKEKGFNVVHTNEDFWENNKGEIVVDNPPYKVEGIVKTKEKIIKRLMELNKPFMLLVPTTTIQTKYFKNLHDGNFQLLIPKNKYDFEKSEGVKSICPFYTLWLCWKMDFPKDYYII